jgi:osmotically-inducible protein OsmY
MTDTFPLRARIAAIAVVATCTLLTGCIPVIIAGGIGAAAFVANDRRANDVILGDERIEKTLNWRLKRELPETARVNVNTFNRMVLLTGEVADAAQKEQAAHAASVIDGVRGVHNELEITNLRTPREQFSDGTITTQVKARMVGNGVVNPLHVQASTDGGIVYLQGLVTKAESDTASRIAAGTAGVRKVVRLFEIIPDSAAQSR